MPHFTGLLDRRERVEVLPIGHEGWVLGDPFFDCFATVLIGTKPLQFAGLPIIPPTILSAGFVDDRFVVVRRGKRRLSAIELAIQPVDPFTFGTVVEVLVVKPGETHIT
jgi:hypothetical protein